MLVTDFISYLESQFPDMTFFNGTIDKNNPKCVGVYVKDGVPPVIAIGGIQNTSYGIKPLRILVHWTEYANQCEMTAQSIYDFFFGKSNFMVGDTRIGSVRMLDSGPISIDRDSNNICEMVVRMDIYYDRRNV